MAYTTFRPRPVGKARINPAWGTKLLMAHLLQENGSTVPDATGLYPLTVAGDATWGTGSWGAQLNYAGVNSTATPPSSFTLSGRSECTVAVLLQGSNAGTYGEVNLSYLCCEENNSDFVMYFRLTTGDNLIHLGFKGCADLSTTYSNRTSWHLVVGRFSAGKQALFIDGLQVASNTGGTATVGNTVRSYGVGNYPPNNARSWRGGIAAHYVWGRGLGDAEILALAADPFAPARPARPSPPLLALGSGALVTGGTGGGGSLTLMGVGR